MLDPLTTAFLAWAAGACMFIIHDNFRFDWNDERDWPFAVLVAALWPVMILGKLLMPNFYEEDDR